MPYLHHPYRDLLLDQDYEAAALAYEAWEARQPKINPTPTEEPRP